MLKTEALVKHNYIKFLIKHVISYAIFSSWQKLQDSRIRRFIFFINSLGVLLTLCIETIFMNAFSLESTVGDFWHWCTPLENLDPRSLYPRMLPPILYIYLHGKKRTNGVKKRKFIGKSTQGKSRCPEAYRWLCRQGVLHCPPGRCPPHPSHNQHKTCWRLMHLGTGYDMSFYW